MKNQLLIYGAVAAGLYLLFGKNAGASTAPGLTLRTDFGTTNPTTWDDAATAPGTSNGAVIGRMTAQ